MESSNTTAREAVMFPRANILLVESRPGQGQEIGDCLKRGLAFCSVARAAAEDALFLANRYDFDLIAFVGETDVQAVRMAKVIKAIKPRAVVVALSQSGSGDGVCERTAPGLDAVLSLPGGCPALAGLLRGAARLRAAWYS